MKKNDSHADRGLRMAVGRKAEMAERMVLPEDFADRLAERLKGEDPPQPSLVGREQIPYSPNRYSSSRKYPLPPYKGGLGRVLIGVAASVVLLLMCILFYREMKTDERPTLAHQVPSLHKLEPKEKHEVSVQPMPKVAKSPSSLETLPTLPVKGRRTPVRRREAPSLYGRAGEGLGRGLSPDTLGNAIWQSEKNVMLALEMLEDCAKTIEQSERMVNNDIVETTFRATPQSPRAILVSNELGDYEVIEPPTTVEI